MSVRVTLGEAVDESSWDLPLNVPSSYLKRKEPRLALGRVRGSVASRKVALGPPLSAFAFGGCTLPLAKSARPN